MIMGLRVFYFFVWLMFIGVLVFCWCVGLCDGYVVMVR